MNSIIKGLTSVVVYQDDVIIHAVDKNSHDACLLALFRRFLDHNVAVNPNKCMFAVTQFDCVGYFIIEHGFRPDPTRFFPLVNVPSPKNMHELRSILGALQYYSRFISNFTQKASDLFDILSN